MKQKEYKTQGVCSRRINFTIDNEGNLRNVKFLGGCMGNCAAISRLVEGLPAQVAVDKLLGIVCGKKNTSCPDQLAQAIKKEIA